MTFEQATIAKIAAQILCENNGNGTLLDAYFNNPRLTPTTIRKAVELATEIVEASCE